MFKSIYYWLINLKDRIVFGDRTNPDTLGGMHAPLVKTLVKYGWKRPPRKINCDGYTFSYDTKDKRVEYTLDIRGWRGDRLFYLGIKKKEITKAPNGILNERDIKLQTLMLENAIENEQAPGGECLDVKITKTYYDGFHNTSTPRLNIFHKPGFFIKNLKDAEEALITIDPYFAEHIREVKLKSLLD